MALVAHFSRRSVRVVFGSQVAFGVNFGMVLDNFTTGARVVDRAGVEGTVGRAGIGDLDVTTIVEDSIF